MTTTKLRRKWIFLSLLYLPVIPECGGAPLSLHNPEESGPFFQGDLILTSFPKSGRVDPKYRWVDRIVHYKFEPGYPTEMQDTFVHATQHISNRTCLRFLECPEEPPAADYLYVVSSVSTSCFSYVGRQGGKQLISLPLGCHRLGTFVHELLHSAGFHHEHSRTDRDDWVQILWGNVMPGKESQFRKYDAATVSSFGVEYDYDSILHYSRNAFSVDGSDTIQPFRGNVQIGQRNGMSDRDIKKVNRMYACETT